jgi:Ca-activated chloride channel homolog
MSMRTAVLACVALACGLAVRPPGAGQGPEEFRLSVDVPQVLLNVTVHARGGGTVSDLEEANFVVYDEGKPQRLTGFSKDQRPATIGLVIDNSHSMTPRRMEVLRAALTFVNASHAEDEFFVVHFNEHARLALGEMPFSSDPDAVRQALWQLNPSGQTALYDAVDLALAHALGGRQEKRALLVISDGGDNASRTGFSEVLVKARRLGSPIYAIGIWDPADPDRSPRVLRRLASAGGGMAYFPRRGADLAEICAEIAREIQSQYTLAFAPAGMGSEGRFRKIRVEVRTADGRRLRARTREGYYEPGKK